MNRSIKIAFVVTLVAAMSLVMLRGTFARSTGAQPASAGPAGAIPDPTVDETLSVKKGRSTIVLAGGCFWGLQAVYEHVRGVSRVTAGYSGGTVKDPSYEAVGSGATGHAESVEIVYDSSKVTLGQLLKVFFSVAHDPTELNRQGPDEGTQYRSAIFFSNPDQQRIALAYVEQLNQARFFNGPIVTQIVPAKPFYRAEAYHQDYAVQHPDNPYIARYDLPKVKQLQLNYPNLYH
jgi:peptide-methionine (S)-S-oxide reductase